MTSIGLSIVSLQNESFLMFCLCLTTGHHLFIEKLWNSRGRRDSITISSIVVTIHHHSNHHTVQKLLECQFSYHIFIPPPLHTSIIATDNHHTVQVAQVPVQYLHQSLDEKTPPYVIQQQVIPSCVLVEYNVVSRTCNGCKHTQQVRNTSISVN